MTCKESTLLTMKDLGADQVPSILVQKFNQFYPKHINKLGGNKKLDKVLSLGRINKAYGFDISFKKEGEPGYDVWKENMDYFKENNMLHSHFYEATGEPKIYEVGGAVWFLDRTNNRVYINKPVITEKERLNLISALSYRLITETNENAHEPSLYVKKYFRDTLNDMEKQLDDFESKIEKDEDYDEDTYLDIGGVFTRISNIYDNPLVMKSIIVGVTDSVKDYNVQYSEDLILQEELKDDSMGIESYIRDSTQVSDDSTLDPEIKKLLNTIVDFDYNKEGFTDKKDSIFEISLPKPQNEVKNKILDLVTNTIELKSEEDNSILSSPYDVMIDKLRVYAKNGDETLRRFLANLDSLYETKSDRDKLAFKVKFFKSFYKGKHTFVLTEVSTNKKEVLSFTKVNPENSQSKESKTALGFAMGMIAADKKDRFNQKVLLSEIIKPNEGEADLKNNISTITTILNSFGIDISYNAIRDLANSDKLLDILLKLETRTYPFKIKGEEGKYEHLTLFKITDNYYDIDNKAYKLRMITDDSISAGLYQLAVAETKYREDLSDSNFNIVGKSTWKYTLMNHMNRKILQWKSGDISELKRLQHKNIPLVNYLLGMDKLERNPYLVNDTEAYNTLINSRIAKLNLVTNAQLRDKLKNNTIEYKKIGESDLIFDNMYKMFNSSDNIHSLHEQFNDSRKDFYADRSKDIALNPFNADKGGSYGLEGIDGMFSGIAVLIDGKIELGKNFRDQFNKLFIGEVNSIQRHSDLIEGYFKSEVKDRHDYLLTKMIPKVHYNTKSTETETHQTISPNGELLTYTGPVNYKYDPEKPESEEKSLSFEYGKDEEGNSIITKVNVNSNHLTRGMIDTALWNNFGFFNGMTRNNPIFEKDFFDNSEGRKFSSLNKVMIEEFLYEPISKDSNATYNSLIHDYLLNIASENSKYLRQEIEGNPVWNNLSSVETNIRNSNTEEFAHTFAAQYILNTLSIYQLFNGDLMYYKQKGANNELNMIDALKRGPSTMTDGLGIYNESSNIEGLDITKTSSTFKNLQGVDIEFNPSVSFPIAIINDIEFNNSKHDFSISEGLKYSQMNNPKTQKLYKNYKHEIADAQGYTTSNHYKDMISKIFGWSDQDSIHHDNLMKKDYIPTEEDFRWLKRSGRTTQGIKLVGFGKNIITPSDSIDDTGIEYPFFLKYAPMPLYPSLTGGTEMDILRDKMESDNISQVISKSGSKASNMTTTTIHNTSSEGTFNGLNSNMKLNPFLVNFSDLKLQVELPSHFDSENTIGTQHLKNLLANIDMNSDKKVYPYRGRMLTGKQMFAEYENAITNQLRAQGRNFLNKYNITIDDDGVMNYDSLEVRELLISQLDIVSDYNLITILQDTDNPLETIPNIAQRLFPILSGFIHKKVGKVRTNTGSAIQIANLGFDRLLDLESDVNNIAFLSNDTEIKPPLPITLSDIKTVEFEKINFGKRENIDKLSEKYHRYRTLLNKENLSIEERADLSTLKSDLDKTQVFYHSINDKAALSLDREMTLEDGTVSTGHIKINKAKIFLPFSSVKRKLGMSYTEFNQAIKDSRKDWEKGLPGRIDRRIFENLISYRIPNQSMSSNDAVEIVGVLPDSYGDTAIVYHEITAKTGSDFNFNRLYLMMPTFSVENKLVLKKNLQNIIFKMSRGRCEAAYLKDKLDAIDINNEFTIPELLTMFHNNKFISDNIAEDILDFLVENTDKLHLSTNPDLEYPLLQKVLNNTLFTNKYATYKNDLSTKGMQNSVVEVMQSILQSEATYDDLMSPLDNDLVVDSIRAIEYDYYVKSVNAKNNNPEIVIEDVDETTSPIQESEIDNKEVLTYDEFIASKIPDPMTMLSPMKMIKARVDMLQAKGLVATMANHMTDVPFTQIQGMGMLINLGFGSPDLSKIYMDEYSYMIGDTMTKSDYFKITQLVSYFMNAAVDAAKDNYIIDGNFISYTSGAAMLLLRSGMHPREVFKMLLDPDIIRLSVFKTAQTELTTNINLGEQGYSNSDLQAYSYEYLNAKRQGLVGNHPMDYEATIKEFETVPDVNRRELKLGLWNLLVEAGKELNNDIATSKADSNGAGKNIYEHISILNKIEQQSKSLFGVKKPDGRLTVLNKLYKDGITKDSDEYSFRFIDPRTDQGVRELEKLTMFGVMNNFSLNLTNSLAKGMFIEATDGFRYMVNSMNDIMGSPLEANVDNIKRSAQSLKTYLLSHSGFPLYNIDESSSIEILESGFAQLSAFKKNRFTKNNGFIKQLYYNNATGLIEFPNFKKFNPRDKAMLSDEFDKLGVLKNKEVQHAMGYLVEYSFITTNFQSRTFGYSEYLPKSYFINRGHNLYIRDLLELLNSNDNETLYDQWSDDAISMMASYNSNYYRLVKKLNVHTSAFNMNIKSGQIITDNYRLESVISTRGTYIPFVKTLYYNPKTKIYTSNLFKLTNIENGYPIYNVMLDMSIEKGLKFKIPNKFIDGFSYFVDKVEQYSISQIGIKNVNISLLGDNAYEYKSPVTKLFKNLSIF